MQVEVMPHRELIVLCKRLRLFSALIRVHNLAARDFVSPVLELLELARPPAEVAHR